MAVVLQFFRDLGPLKVALVILSSLVFLILLMIFMVKVSSPQMSVLYAGLDLEDSNKIVQELETRGVQYELMGGGTIIKVPEDRVLRLRIALAENGIPGKGSVVGYEIFDREDSLGTTNFMQNIKLLRALEGELSRTISNLEKIEKAIVHLVIPKKELFSKERQDPRASIVLKLRGSKTLSKNEVDAIGHIVATAVPELDIKNITIVDTKGSSLKLGMRDGESGDGYSSSVNDERKIIFENRLKNSVESLLEKTIGHGKVIAQINAEMNFDKIVSNTESYDPEGAVLRSSQNISETETNSSGEENMDVSVANNIPGGESSQENSSSGSSVERIDETQNFEISKTIMNKIQEVGQVKKLSVAILVDGNYKKNPETEEYEYTPRSEEELKQIEDLVKVAVGFDPDRDDKISVVNMKFQSEDIDVQEYPSDWIKDQLPSLVQTIVLAVVIILVFLTVVRPIALRAFDIRKDEVQSSPSEQYPYVDDALSGGINQQDVALNISRAGIEVASSNESIKKVNDNVEIDVQNSVAVIKRWLNEDK